MNSRKNEKLVNQKTKMKEQCAVKKDCSEQLQGSEPENQGPKIIKTKDSYSTELNLKKNSISNDRLPNNKNVKVKIQKKIFRRERKFFFQFQALLSFGLLFNLRLVSGNPKYSFSQARKQKSDESASSFCTETGSLTILTYWFKPGIQISFQTDGDLSSRTFITSAEDSNKKQYTMFNRGSNCQTVDPAFGGHIFISLVIEDHPSTPGKCQVTKIATTSKLVACSTLPPATTTTDVETLISMKIGSFDEVSASDIVYEFLYGIFK